ncbi:MAG TPA: late competence development ComFB family protein [Gemmatimonadales bacterium]|jgi:hypothetical protein
MIVNVMERHVRDAYDRLKASVNGLADSPGHREDVVVYALNRLPPRYVVTDAGMAVTEVALDGAQQRTEIDVKVLEAMRHIAARPRSGP